MNSTKRNGSIAEPVNLSVILYDDLNCGGAKQDFDCFDYSEAEYIVVSGSRLLLEIEKEISDLNETVKEAESFDDTWFETESIEKLSELKDELESYPPDTLFAFQG